MTEINLFLFHHATRQGGAILVDNLEIANIDVIFGSSGEEEALEAEFKIFLNAYLKELVASPVRTLSDVIAFNNKFSHLVSAIICGFHHLFVLLDSARIIKITF